jgi:peptidoglycan/LPS O-acetylase OafA/YrhL
MNHPRNRFLGGARSTFDWLANKLSRVTSSGEFIPEIDGLRFIAISTVIFHHLLAMFLANSGRSPEVRSPA